MIKSGSGNLVLSGNNTYGGDTLVEGGTISIGSDTAVGEARLIFFDGSATQASGGAHRIINSVVLGLSSDIPYLATVTAGGSNDLTLSGNITQGNNATGSLVKVGTGTLTLPGPSAAYHPVLLSALGLDTA